MARFVALMFLCLLVVLTLTSVVLAQVPTGIPDFGTYDANGVVTINLAYLSTHVQVPITYFERTKSVRSRLSDDRWLFHNAGHQSQYHLRTKWRVEDRLHNP